MAPTAWENSAIAHVQQFRKILDFNVKLQYKIPEINLNHVKKMTTNFGIIQFSVINHPDKDSGYTVDDNARALIAMCLHYKIFRTASDLKYITIYFDFISYSFQEEGCFLNYINFQREFTAQNSDCNLEDSFGRAIWALGYLLSLHDIIPEDLIRKAQVVFNKAVLRASDIHSTRSMAFIIKGLYYVGLKNNSLQNRLVIEELADRLVQMYRHETDDTWQWYESYLTYANSVIPEAMLLAWLTIRKSVYRSIAASSFDFLISKIFSQGAIKVISNKGWMHNNKEIDAAHKSGNSLLM
ncbi:hypothetical protein [Chryseobacterium wanjuense]